MFISGQYVIRLYTHFRIKFILIVTKLCFHCSIKYATPQGAVSVSDLLIEVGLDTQCSLLFYRVQRKAVLEILNACISAFV